LLAIVEAHFLSVLIGAFVANALGALAVLPCRSAVSRSSEGHLEALSHLQLGGGPQGPSCSAACGVKWPSMPRLLNLKSRPSSAQHGVAPSRHLGYRYCQSAVSCHAGLLAIEDHQNVTGLLLLL
jgi:hypothetical protein